MKPIKAACIDGNPDLEAVRRDAKVQGPKTKTMLAELEKQANVDNESTGLHDLWMAWRTAVGPSIGYPRCGIFKWQQNADNWSAKEGTRSKLGRVLVTQKEFEDKLEAKGQTKEWARAEWLRRRASPEFKNGVCLGLSCFSTHRS